MISLKIFIAIIITIVILTNVYVMIKPPTEYELKQYKFSSDKSKSINIIKTGFENYQVLINFHNGIKGGAGVFSVETDSVKIKLKWLTNHSFKISYPKNAKTSQREELIKFFRDSVFIEYVEY